jgi:hypothetical protein
MKMENRETEIKDLVSSFVASIQAVITRWRQIDGVDALKHFEAAVEVERQRYQRKFDALRSDEDCDRDLIDNVEQQINQIAVGEIARCKATGIDFDQLTTALRDTGRGLANAVSKLEGKGN